MLKRFLRHPKTLAVLARLIGLYLAFVLRTTRWRLDGAQHLAAQRPGMPMIIAFWHECLPMMPIGLAMARSMPQHVGSAQKAHVLVSHHRDGQFIGAIVRRFGLGIILGSTSRGGASGLILLLHALRSGDFVAISPDGPRGPARKAAPGVAQLAAMSGAAVLPCAARSTRQRRLGSWDRMMIPLPFGRGAVALAAPVMVPREGWEASVPAIEAALNAAAARVEEMTA